MIWKVVVFWVVLAVLLFSVEQLVDCGVRKSNYSWYNKVNLIMEHQADPEIAVFGSSVGEVGIDAPEIHRVTSRSIYNFSIDGTRFSQYRGLIAQLNQYTSRCRLVVLAETFFSLTPVDQLTEVDRYMAYIDNENIYTPLHDIQPELTWKLRYVPFYKFTAMKHPYYKASIYGWRQFISGASAPDSSLGYTPKYMSWEPGLDEENRIAKPITVVVEENATEDYRATISKLVGKGMKVLIVLPPIYKDGLTRLVNIDGLRKTFSSMSGEGVSFVDYSICDLSSNKEYFYNNSHLNASGAKAFAAYLTRDIDSILNRSN
jgi:hypothetical protein